MFADDAELSAARQFRGYNAWLCRVPSVQHGMDPHTVALLLPSKTGNNYASIVVSRLSQDFPNVRSVVLCGIAGGCPTPSDPDRAIYLGDLVMANQIGVHQYDFGHARHHKGHAKRGQLLDASQEAIAPDDVFIGIANRLLTMDLREDRPWNDRLDDRLPELVKRNLKFARPTTGEDVFSYEQIVDRRKSITIERKSTLSRPRLFCGAIGSANSVLKDPWRRDALRDGKHRILAVEMEGSGVADACRVAGYSFTIVRGICDYCDQHKKDYWQFYAAAAAAALAHCVIQHLPNEPSRVRMGERGVEVDDKEIIRSAQAAAPANAQSASTVTPPTGRRTRQAVERPTESRTSFDANRPQAVALDQTLVSSAISTPDSLLQQMDIDEANRNWDHRLVLAKQLEILLDTQEVESSLKSRGFYEIARTYYQAAQTAHEGKREEFIGRSAEAANKAGEAQRGVK